VVGGLIGLRGLEGVWSSDEGCVQGSTHYERVSRTEAGRKIGMGATNGEGKKRVITKTDSVLVPEKSGPVIQEWHNIRYTNTSKPLKPTPSPNPTPPHPSHNLPSPPKYQKPSTQPNLSYDHSSNASPPQSLWRSNLAKHTSEDRLYLQTYP